MDYRLLLSGIPIPLYSLRIVMRDVSLVSLVLFPAEVKTWNANELQSIPCLYPKNYWHALMRPHLYSAYSIKIQLRLLLWQKDKQSKQEQLRPQRNWRQLQTTKASSIDSRDGVKKQELNKWRLTGDWSLTFRVMWAEQKSLWSFVSLINLTWTVNLIWCTHSWVSKTSRLTYYSKE